MSDYTINPMTSHETGAEIIGLDLSRPVGDEMKKQINADFAKYHVLVFRGQKLKLPSSPRRARSSVRSCNITTRKCVSAIPMSTR